MSELNLETNDKTDAAQKQNQDQQQGNSQAFATNKDESGDRNPEEVEKGLTERPDEESSEATSWRSDDSFSGATKQKTFTGEASDLEDKAAGA